MRRIHPNANDPQGWLSRERLRALALLIGTALALYLCYRLAEPFLQSLAWALALAVVAYPLHVALLRRLHQPGLAAAVTATTVGLVVVAPAFFIAHNLVREAASAGAGAQWWLGSEGSASLLARYPAIAPLWGWARSLVDIPTATGELVKAQAPSAVAATLWVIVNLLVAFFMLFYFLRDHRTALAHVRDLVPLANDEVREMIEVVRDTIRAIVFGTVVVALVQGTLGGLMFWLLDLPSPLLWGTIMALLAMIPYLGAFLVWLPAAALLAMSGSWEKALLLGGWGITVVSLADNFLYPLLVGSKLRLHTLPVFLALVGGVLLFGAAGIILGPVTLAVTIALLGVWRRRTASGRTADGPPTADTDVKAQLTRQQPASR